MKRLLAMLLPIPAEWTGWAVLPICLYLPLAMRTTYGVGWLGAILRCFVLSIFYLIAVVLALVGAVAAAVLL